MNEPQAIRVSVKAIVVQDGQILLIGYDLDDGFGFHYNLPGGGVKSGEGLHEALQREVWEEVSALVDVRQLLFVTEYVPSQHSGKYGPTQSLQLYFYCDLRPESQPAQPNTPIDDQKGVYWLPLSELHTAPLLPNIGERIQEAFSQGFPVTDLFVADWKEKPALPPAPGNKLPVCLKAARPLRD